MNIISDFKVIDTLDDYDKKRNPQGLSVFELLPTGITWVYAGKRQEIYDDNKLIYLIDFKMHRDGKGANPREHR
ncbi:hypothetical protein [Photorhabdus akhurstii]|uniref:hypothetical protein n=1 Tax=Photorhabdus akhurstii TaxID=171438 RepID=UPI001C2E4CCC|nr:hypothetical protein [Photorhabdus akhurstii]